jgi:hypothetical protein
MTAMVPPREASQTTIGGAPGKRAAEENEREACVVAQNRRPKPPMRPNPIPMPIPIGRAIMTGRCIIIGRCIITGRLMATLRFIMTGRFIVTLRGAIPVVVRTEPTVLEPPNLPGLP